jgi:hypothetical protein
MGGDIGSRRGVTASALSGDNVSHQASVSPEAVALVRLDDMTGPEAFACLFVS